MDIDDLRKKHEGFLQIINDLRSHLKKAREFYNENLEVFRKELYKRHSKEAEEWYNLFANQVMILQFLNKKKEELYENIRLARRNENNDYANKLKKQALKTGEEIIHHEEIIKNHVKIGLTEIFGQDAKIMSPNIIRDILYNSKTDKTHYNLN